MPRLSTLARGYGSWNGDLEQEKQSYLKDIATPILPQYLSSEHQPFYKEKTVKFPIRTKANHEVIKTILAEAERIKSAKNRNHNDPPTIAEEIQSKVPMTQPSREQSGRSQRWKSRPEFRTNHRSVNNHLRTRSAPGTNKRFAIKADGELQLPKTFVTRKGAMVLFTAPSAINFTKEGRCFSPNYKTKKDISNLSLSLGTIGKLCSSVLQYGEPTWEDDDLDSVASQQFHKTCMRFIRDEEGEECFDYRVQPGADFNFYLHDMQTRAVVRNLTRCNSAYSLTSTEAAEELNEALDNMDNNHHYKQDDSNGKPGLITADANRLVESISCASTSTPEKSLQFRETFSHQSTTQGSERSQRAAEMMHMPLTLAAGERKSRLGSGRSMTSSRTSTPLSCARLTASLKSTNYLGRPIAIPRTASGFEDDDSKIMESEMEDTYDSGGRMLLRQQSVKSFQSVTSMTADSRPHSRATNGSGDAAHDAEIFEDCVIKELGDETEQQYFEDNNCVDATSHVGRRRCSLLSSVVMDDDDEDEFVDLMQHQDGRSSQLSRRSRRSSAQRTKTPDANTSRRSSLKMENGVLSEFDDTAELSKIPSKCEGELEMEKEGIEEDAEENGNGTLQSATPAIGSAEMEQLIGNDDDDDADNSVAALGAVVSRPQTAGSSHYSVRSLHRPASCTSNVESSVDFNNEQLQNIDGLVLDAVESLQHDTRDGEHVVDPGQVETHPKSSTGIIEESSTPKEVTLSKTKDKQSVQSAPILTEGSELSMQPLKPLQSSLAPLASNGVSNKETPLFNNAKMEAPSVKEEKQSQQVEKFPEITPPQKISSPEPKPPPPRVSSPKVSSPMQINPVHTKQTVGMTPKPPIMKAPLPQTSPAAKVNKAVIPIHAGALPKMEPDVAPMKNVDSGPLKATTRKPKSRGNVTKKKVIGGPQFNDGLVKETYDEPGADEIEKMIQEELEKDLKEHGLIEISEEGAGATSSTDNLKSGKVETEVGLDNQQENTEINLDTDDETIAKEVKKISKGKKKSKKQILKEREELRELKRKERRLKEEEAKAMKAMKKAAEKEKMMAEEAARRKKIEMEEEIQDAEREAEAAREAEEQARLMLLESRKQAREEREAKRKAEMDRKKEERNRQREQRKKMEEAARKREQEMKEKLASVEDIRRQKELEREMEWEREEKEREEREEMERQEEEEKRKMEEEEERIRELEKEAEEEALARLVREREEAEQRMKAAALEAQRQKDAEEQLRLEEQRKQEEEAERRRLQELEEERLLDIERQRILQIKRIEDEARARVLKKLEGKRIWAMRRRDANVQRFAHLNSVRRTQGMTRPWVFSYYVHWPRQTYEKKLPSAKKKQRRPIRPPKPPAETPINQAAS
ncbi:titin homolog [Anneissia japonica]|uniref:titin homolog n=1 Tax=Anneissia japonica TaxID=1529436 RepID=UPI0014255D8E|nr:titin homolog [Anneissia japonica]